MPTKNKTKVKSKPKMTQVRIESAEEQNPKEETKTEAVEKTEPKKQNTQKYTEAVKKTDLLQQKEDAKKTEAVKKTDTQSEPNKTHQDQKTETVETIVPVQIVTMEPGSKTDCTLLTKCKRYAFRVHSIILEANSPVFRDLDFCEPVVLDATNIVLHRFIEVVYNKYSPTTNVEDWISVTQLLHKYEIQVGIMDGTFYRFINDSEVFMDDLILIATCADECKNGELYEDCLRRISHALSREVINTSRFTPKLKMDLFPYLCAQ